MSAAGVLSIIMILHGVLFPGNSVPAADEHPDRTEKAKVTFQVITGENDDSSRIYITGNDSLLGWWAPDGLPLKRVSGELWEISIPLDYGKNLEYKFTRGSWTTEALKADGSVPENHLIKITSDTTLSHRITGWRRAVSELKKGPRISGTAHFHHDLTFPGLRPRDIIVWLPPGYEADMEQRYPVLYMHDGQNIFAPETSTFGHDWRVDETTDSLISENLMQPIIVVAIYNTPDRAKEYAPGVMGRLYMKFITDSVKAFVDHNYRTLPGPAYTATGGSSQGGLIAFMLFWEYPEVFTKAACLSPAFRFRDVDYLTAVRTSNLTPDGRQIYFDVGTTGIDSVLLPQVKEISDLLAQKGFLPDKQIFTYIDQNARHSETFWARRFWRPLLIFWGTCHD